MTTISPTVVSPPTRSLHRAPVVQLVADRPLDPDSSTSVAKALALLRKKLGDKEQA